MWKCFISSLKWKWLHYFWSLYPHHDGLLPEGEGSEAEEDAAPRRDEGEAVPGQDVAEADSRHLQLQLLNIDSNTLINSGKVTVRTKCMSKQVVSDIEMFDIYCKDLYWQLFSRSSLKLWKKLVKMPILKYFQLEGEGPLAGYFYE